MNPLSHTRKRRVPLAFSCTGKAGEVILVEKRPPHLFRGAELFATDTSRRPGYATVIKDCYVGMQRQFGDVPTWMFSEWLPAEELEAYEKAAQLNGTKFETADTRAAASRLRMANAAARMTWDTCNPVLPVIFQIRFEEDCNWEAVLWGDELR